MTQLQELIYNVIPPNLLEKDNISKLMDIFFRVVDDACKISADLPEYININTPDLKEDIIRIYLENIHSILEKVKNDVLETGIGDIPFDDRKNYCYSDGDIHLQTVFTNIFLDNSSTGLNNIIVSHELVVQEYFNGVDIEYNKTFILIDNTGLTSLTTVDQAVTNNNIIASSLCCSTIPCALGTLPQCSVGTDISTYINSYTGTNLANDILLDFGGVATDCVSNSNVIDNAGEAPYKIGSNWMFVDFYIGKDYIDSNLSLKSLLNTKENINEEHIWSSKNYKQNKGHAVAFYFAYNIIKEVELDSGSSQFDSLEYMKLEEVFKDEEIVPFEYIVKSLIHEYVYYHVIHPLSHPVGFNGEYQRTLGFNFSDNFCKNKIQDYDSVFIYCIEQGTYFDVRDGDGLFGTNGLQGNLLRYNTEIQDYYYFEQHNKTFVSILLNNGYSYVKGFDDKIVMLDNVGIVLKTFDKSCGFVPIKTIIKCNNPGSTTTYLETVDNERTTYNTIDPVTLIPATKVYRIDFNNDGLEEGGFLSNEHSIIYLDNNVQYHIANNRISLQDSLNTEISNMGPNCKMLYNGMGYKDISLCFEKLEWIIYQEMRDTIVPHYLIVQEDILISNPSSSENLSLVLNQTDSELNINTYINDYFLSHGNYNNMGNEILTHGNNPYSINIHDESLQGIDVNYDGIPDVIYLGNKQDWGWILGAKGDGTLLPDYDTVNMNTWIASYVGNNMSRDINIWLDDKYSYLIKVSPKVGKYDNGYDYLDLDEYLHFN